MTKKEVKYLGLGCLFLLLTVVLVFGVLKFGAGLAVRVASVIQGTNATEEATLTEKIIPPPQLYSLPEATKSAELKVAGVSQPNQFVEIFFNGEAFQAEVNSEGIFEQNVNLTDGSNEIYAVAKSVADQKSTPSRSWMITLDTTPPELTISQPADGAQIKEKTAYVVVTGQTEPTASVAVNDSLAVVDDKGAYQNQLGLAEGENTIKVVATDLAGNTTEKEAKVKYIKR